MTHREEVLKKINSELEKLSDEELDAVAGSSFNETAADSFELYDHGLLKDYHNAVVTGAQWNKISSEVDKAWHKAGVDVITKPFGDNEYKIDGKIVTRNTALEQLDKKFDRIKL